jgi:hypothetical protein
MSGTNTHRAGALAALLAAAALAGIGLPACGGSAIALQPAGLDLPTTAPRTPLASTTVYTSPDGGIYRNPLHLDVLMVARRSVDQLAVSLGATRDWAPLRALGDFTLVAVRLRNDGKAWADPDVRDLQIAADHAPSQAASGPLHAYYHPTYPLASISDTAPGSECRPHLDPGQTTIVVLVYPPISIPAEGIVWGRYQEFAVRIPEGGGVGQWTDRPVSTALCPAPAAPRQ